MAAPPFNLRIISPQEILFDGQVVGVRFPGEDGELGVLANHATMVALTKSGSLRVRSTEDDDFEFVVHSGFAEMRNNVLTVLTRAAENVESIDLDRAQKAAERARDRLRDAEGSFDKELAREALSRALMREMLARK